MKNILSVLILSSMLFTSCKKEETTEETTEETVTEDVATDTTTVAPDSLTTTSVPSTPQAGATTNSVMLNQPTTGSTAAPSPPPQKVAKGMNPAHGQPGHRCDIEVGMPLNSPPGGKAANSTPSKVTQTTTVTPEMLNQTNTSTPAATSTPVVTAPGMNPPHGQEGHVCAVPVGEPLPKK